MRTLLPLLLLAASLASCTTQPQTPATLPSKWFEDKAPLPTSIPPARARASTSVQAQVTPAPQTTWAVVQWDQPSTANVAGFTLYWWLVGVATNSASVTNAAARRMGVTNLVVGADYHFAATAFGWDGTNRLESEFSNELVWRAVVPPALLILTLQGSTNSAKNYTDIVTLTNVPNSDWQFYRMKINKQ